jgi:hypothetical protein
MMFQKRCVVTESRDFSAFQTPLQPIPQRVEAAIALGVQSGKDFPFASAAKLLSEGGDGLVDAVVRNHDGVLVVACLTEMPGVTPQMWDWWFGWHGLSSERYRLWHPKEHLRSAMAENREHIRDARERYIGNTSYIEEYVGPGEPHKLSVAFRMPSELGLDESKVAAQGTAICARGGFPDKFVETAYLIHFVRRTPAGCEMLSRFWLGHINSKIPVIGRFISRRMNTRATRIELIPDQFGLNLLRHCSEEMGHLAAILPGLYAKFQAD